MADISRELQAIEDAVFGEEVRGSIHDAIDLINKVGEKNISVGTDVTSTSSPISGYYEDSLYLNEITYDLWKCNGTAWELVGNLKGEAGGAGAWVFVTEAQWNAFDKSRLNNNDTIMFLWDRTSTGDSNYMLESDYVGNSAAKKVHRSDIADNSTKLNGRVASTFANSDDLGTLKFRVNSGNAQYTKDNGGTWVNFRNPTGTAEASNVLVGKTFANASSDSVNGTMVNNGAFTGTIIEKDGSVTIPEGYHNGQGYINATYSTGSPYGCFKISDSVTSLSNFDVDNFCNTIKSDYDIDIDAGTLTNDNFIVGNYSTYNYVWSSAHTEGTDGVTPYNVQQGCGFTKPSINYNQSTKKLSIGGAQIKGGAQIHGIYNWYITKNLTFSVYLVLMP